MTEAYIDPERLAATWYAEFDPEHTRRTRFGRFVHIPQFPRIRDANQLFDCRCGSGEASEFLDELDTLYENTGLGFRKIAGHCPRTLECLRPELTARGWKEQSGWMLVHRNPPQRPVNVEVRIEVVDAASERGRDSSRKGPTPDWPGYKRAQDGRLGGSRVLAFLDGDLAGSTGWYVVDGLARFRYVHTVESARGRGVATTMVRAIQDHPEVKECEALVICCDDEGPLQLYEQLGFVRQGVTWEFLKFV